MSVEYDIIKNVIKMKDIRLLELYDGLLKNMQKKIKLILGQLKEI